MISFLVFISWPTAVSPNICPQTSMFSEYAFLIAHWDVLKMLLIFFTFIFTFSIFSVIKKIENSSAVSHSFSYLQIYHFLFYILRDLQFFLNITNLICLSSINLIVLDVNFNPDNKTLIPKSVFCLLKL